MKNINCLNLCNRYGYPLEINKILTDTISIIIQNIQPYSILLFGSASRGELSYHFLYGEIDVLSDIEFAVVTYQQVSPKTQSNINRQILSFVKACNNKSPFFHIDISFITLDRLKQAPPILRYMEARMNGYVLFGVDIRQCLPQITTSNLDIGQTRELILTRLWNMLLCIPKSYVRNTSSEYENLIMLYNVSRNALDVLTIFLVLNKIFISGYQARLNFLYQEGASALQWASHLGSDFRDFIQMALDVKLNPSLSIEINTFYARTLMAYNDLMRWMLKAEKKFEIESLINLLNKSNLGFLVGRKHKWIAYETLLIMRYWKSKKIRDWIEWLLIKKRESMVCFLLAMHSTLLQDNINDVQRMHWVRMANNHFNNYSLKCNYLVESNISNWPELWLTLREEFVDSLFPILRFDNEKRDYYSGIVRWKNG